MAYKKYIRRNGKIFGPYLYESHRENGRVINRYVGSEEISSERKSSSFNFCKSELLVGGILILSLVVLLLIFSSVVHTGKVSLSIEPSYLNGEIIQGEINFELSSGEFIPADSDVILQLNDAVVEMKLSELVSNSASSGDFFAEDVSLSGNGEGYGGNESMDLEIDISKFKISAEEGILHAQLVYGDVEIASSSEDIIIEEEEPAEVLNDTITNDTIISNASTNDSIIPTDNTSDKSAQKFEAQALSASNLIIQNCLAENDAANNGTFPDACDGVYPSATCGTGADLLRCDDSQVETMGMTSSGWAGIKIVEFNPSVTNCTAVSDVFFCHEWWTGNGAGSINCIIAIDNQNGANWTIINNSCPVQGTPNPGVTCQNVTSLKKWTCDNFFGTSGNKSRAKAEAIRSSGASSKEISWDVFYFNLTSGYDAAEDKYPNATLILPADNYVNNSAAVVNVTFNCLASDDYNLKNISLHITNASNKLFRANSTKVISGLSNSTTWILALGNGNYTWNCYACDNSSQCSFAAANRTIIINYGAFDTTAPAISVVYPQNITYNVNVSALNYTYFDANPANCWYSTNGGVANSTLVNAGVNFTGITSTEGSNTWRVYCNDTFGNRNSTTRVFFVDSCVPNLTNGSWSGWNNLSCVGEQRNQSRQKTQYDINNCGEIANQTFYEYLLVGPVLANTTWSNWTNVSCLFGDKMNQTRNLTRYDVYACAANTTLFEYRATESCDFCTPNMTNTTESAWTNQGDCKTDDLQLQNRSRIEYDTKNCGEIENSTNWDYQNVSCNYCSYNLTNVTSAWQNQTSCRVNDTFLQNKSITEYDSNYQNCYALTGILSDLWNSGNNNTYWEYKGDGCNFCSENITGPFNTTCLPSNTLEQYYTDMSYGSCCALTGIVSDCSINNNPSYANQTFACQYDTIPPSFNSGNTQPIAGAQYNQTNIISIVVNPSENSTVFANISWDATSQIVNFVYNGTQWFYTTGFSNTTLPGVYTIVINATDASGNSNTTTTNFAINDVSAPLIGQITPSEGAGYNPYQAINITANVTDLYYDSVSSVIAQITYPDGTSVNYALIEIDNTQIFDYFSFNDTNATGRYNITIIANDSAGNVNISRSWFNITLEDVTAPVITESDIEPYDPAFGTNVSFNASASDNVAISGIFANITLPNGTVIVLEMPTEYVIRAAGRHNVTFWANDTSGNIGTFDDYFIASENYYNVTFNIVNSNLSGIPVNLTIYFADTDKVVHMHEFNGSFVDSHGDILYDLYYETIDDGVNVKLNGINLSIYNNHTLGVDKRYSILGYLVVYGVNSIYGFTNAIVQISYAGTGYTNENALILEKCGNWDFVNWNCLSGWSDITNQSSQDTSEHYFRTNVSSFSGFGIRDATIMPPSGPSGGGGGIYLAPVAGGADLALDNDLIEVRLLQGETAIRSLMLTSRDNRTFNMTLRVEGLDGLVNLAESRFRLDAVAMKEINLEFYASMNQKPGVYAGRIVIDSGFGEKIVNVIIEIKARSPLLDVIVKLMPGFKRVCPGITANSVVTLRNIGLQKEFELTLVLSVRDLNKNLIFEVSRETIKMNESIVNISREFVVPKYFADGKYMLLAQADYDNFQAESYEIFEVVGKTKTSICEILALLALLAGFIWLIFLLFKKKHRERVLKIEQLVQVKITHPLAAGYKLPKSKPTLMHKLYMFFVRAGKAFDGFAYSFVEGMRKTFAAVSAGINGLLEGIVEFMRFLIHGIKMLLIKLARAFEVLISGAVEFLRYLIYGVVMFFRTLIYGIESNAESFAHGVKLAERRTVRKAVNAEQGAISDFREIFDRLGKGVMDFAYFLIYGFRMFLISIGSFIVGLFFGMAGFARFLVKGVQRLFFGFSRFAVGLVFGAVEFFGYLIYGLGKFSNSLISGADQEVELFVHNVKLAKRMSLRKGNELENRVMSYIERWFARVLESLESKTERGNVPEEISAEQKDIYVLNAEKNILRNEIKKLDAEFKRGTLDSKGYLKTREKLGKEIWDIKHRM